MVVTERELLDRRTRKKNRTRDDLVDAAMALFAERGFDETTTEDIAEAADVSQRTFFRHFPSKEAVLYGDNPELLGRFRSALDATDPTEPVVASVRAAVLALADDYEERPGLRLLQARLAGAYPSVSEYSRAVVQHAWERELIDFLGQRLATDPETDARPEIIAAASMAALRASIRRWARGGGRDDLLALVADALDQLEAMAGGGASPDRAGAKGR